MKNHRVSFSFLNGLVLTLLSLSISIGKLQAATVTVDVATDSGGSGCELRFAIQSINMGSDQGNCTADISNTYGTSDAIHFNIPGAGVHTIQSASALPNITKPVTIDGYSQPGASPNALANSDNAVLLIELDGTNAGAILSGLELQAGASGSTIR